MISGGNGILDKAGEAVEVNKVAAGKEQLELYYYELIATEPYGQASIGDYVDILNKNGIPTQEEDGKVKAEIDGIIYEITEKEDGTLDITHPDGEGGSGTITPPVQIPSAEENPTDPSKNPIIVGEIEWNDGIGSLPITKNENVDNNLKMEYKVNDGEWKEINSGDSIPNLKDGNIVTAKLTDERNNRSDTATLYVQLSAEKQEELALAENGFEKVLNSPLLNNNSVRLSDANALKVGGTGNLYTPMAI